MKSEPKITRPKTLAEVAERSPSIEDFGMNFRDWEHEISRGGVHGRPELAKRIEESPRLLADRFESGDVADAMLAATAEWLAETAGIPKPVWCIEPQRTANTAWFGSPAHSWLEEHAPEAFRRRNLFTVPTKVFTPKAGRPPVSEEQKREKARQRQRAYRQRIRKLVEFAREQQT